MRMNTSMMMTNMMMIIITIFRNLVPEITICTLKLGSELLHCTIAVSGE